MSQPSHSWKFKGAQYGEARKGGEGGGSLEVRTGVCAEGRLEGEGQSMKKIIGGEGRIGRQNWGGEGVGMRGATQP